MDVEAEQTQVQRSEQSNKMKQEVKLAKTEKNKDTRGKKKPWKVLENPQVQNPDLTLELMNSGTTRAGCSSSRLVQTSKHLLAEVLVRSGWWDMKWMIKSLNTNTELLSLNIQEARELSGYSLSAWVAGTSRARNTRWRMALAAGDSPLNLRSMFWPRLHAPPVQIGVSISYVPAHSSD